MDSKADSRQSPYTMSKACRWKCLYGFIAGKQVLDRLEEAGNS